jgi:hypothetical protein
MENIKMGNIARIELTMKKYDRETMNYIIRSLCGVFNGKVNAWTNTEGMEYTGINGKQEWKARVLIAVANNSKQEWYKFYSIIRDYATTYNCTLDIMHTNNAGSNRLKELHKLISNPQRKGNYLRLYKSFSKF